MKKIGYKRIKKDMTSKYGACKFEIGKTYKIKDEYKECYMERDILLFLSYPKEYYNNEEEFLEFKKYMEYVNTKIIEDKDELTVSTCCLDPTRIKKVLLNLMSDKTNDKVWDIAVVSTNYVGNTVNESIVYKVYVENVDFVTRGGFTDIDIKFKIVEKPCYDISRAQVVIDARIGKGLVTREEV